MVNLPIIPVTSVAVYEGSGDEPIPLDRLRPALARLLDSYPVYTGRLAIASADASLTVDRLGSGAVLLEARCSLRLDELPRTGPAGQLVMSDLPTAGNALLAPFEATNEGVCRGPLLSVQHTRFACGAVALGLRLLHVVADAEAFFQLQRDLAELYHSIGDGRAPADVKLADPPHIVSYRSELRRKDMAADELKAALASRPALFATDSSRVRTGWEDEPQVVSPAHAVAGRVLRYSEAELAALKAAATAPDGSGVWVSTFDALAAHLYQSVYRARVALWAQDVRPGLPCGTLHVPVNVRRQLGLPARYAANAPLTTTLALAPDLLVEGAPLWKVARAVHDLTRQKDVVDPDEIERTLRWIVAQPHKDEVKLHFALGDGALLLTAWHRFDMHASLAYDGVRPTLVSTPFTPVSLLDGIGITVPTESHAAGGIDVNLALSEPLWALLERDARFMRP